jgi:hypothetical protein
MMDKRTYGARRPSIFAIWPPSNFAITLTHRGRGRQARRRGAPIEGAVDKLDGDDHTADELRARPWAVGWILKRFEVPSTVSLQALHEHWKSRFAASPQERAWFDYVLPWYAHRAHCAPW